MYVQDLINDVVFLDNAITKADKRSGAYNDRSFQLAYTRIENIISVLLKYKTKMLCLHTGIGGLFERKLCAISIADKPEKRYFDINSNGWYHYQSFLYSAKYKVEFIATGETRIMSLYEITPIWLDIHISDMVTNFDTYGDNDEWEHYKIGSIVHFSRPNSTPAIGMIKSIFEVGSKQYVELGLIENYIQTDTIVYAVPSSHCMRVEPEIEQLVLLNKLAIAS